MVKKSFEIDRFVYLYKKSEEEAINYLEKEVYKHTIEWYRISWIDNFLSENFINKFKDKLDWRYLSSHQILSEKIIEENMCKYGISFLQISQHQVLSQKFIDKYLDELDFDFLVEFQDLSLEFLIKHREKIKINILKKNIQINERVKQKFLNYIKLIK